MQEKLPFERVLESSINNRAKKFHFLKYFFRGEFSFILGGSGWKVQDSVFKNIRKRFHLRFF